MLCSLVMISGCGKKLIVQNGEVIGEVVDGERIYYDTDDESVTDDISDDTTDVDEGSAVSALKDDVEISDNSDAKDAIYGAKDTAGKVKKAINAITEVKAGNARKLLGKSIQSAIISGIASSVTSDDVDSWLENDEYWVQCADSLSIDNGTLSQFEWGSLDGSYVRNGDYAAYSLGNFLFVVGEVKDGQMTGWYYAYDELTGDAYLQNAESGKKEDLFYVTGADLGDLTTKVYGDVIVAKSEGKTWRIDMVSGNVEYTHGDNFFTGNDYAFDSKINGHDISWREFSGVSVDGENNYVDYYSNKEQFGANLQATIKNLNPKDYTLLQELFADAAGSAIASIPGLSLLDDLSGGSIAEEFSRQILKNFDKPKEEEGKGWKYIEGYENNARWKPDSQKSMKLYNYSSGLIKGKVETGVVSNKEAERLASLTTEERIVEEREKLQAEHKAAAEEGLQKVLEEREQRKKESEAAAAEAMEKVRESYRERGIEID